MIFFSIRPAIAGVIVGILFVLVIAIAVVFIAGFIRRRFYMGSSKITDLVKINNTKNAI